jgi:hypothetical protein
MPRIARIIQLLVSLAVAGLFWLIYPGVMVIVATAAGLLYVAASLFALRGSKLATWIALTLSVATAVLTTLAVLRFAGNSFSYLAVNFKGHGGIYRTPYAFLAIAIGAALAVILQVVAARPGRSGGVQS